MKYAIIVKDENENVIEEIKLTAREVDHIYGVLENYNDDARDNEDNARIFKEEENRKYWESQIKLSGGIMYKLLDIEESEWFANDCTTQSNIEYK